MNPNRNPIKRFFVATVLTASLALAAHAQPPAGFEPPAGMMPHHGPHDMMAPHGPGMLPPYLRDLKLSDAQEDKIFVIVHAQAPQMREQMKAMKKAHEQMRELALADQYDEGRAKALADTAAKAMSEMSLQRLRTDRQILAVLTPEQRQTLAGKNFR